MTTQEIIALLKERSDPQKVLIKATKLGITSTNALGIYHKDLKEIAKEIPKDDPLCVNGTLNAIAFTSEHSGTQTIIGRGAGGMETASSILRDLLDIRQEIART